MALPRPALLGILGLALIAATFLASRAATGGDPPVEGSAPNPPATADTDAAGGGEPLSPPKELARPDARLPAERGRAGEPAAPAPREPKDGPRAEGGLPRPLARALARDKVIVLLLAGGRSADDLATRRSFKSLEARRGRVALFSDRLSRLGRYTDIVAGLGVTQTPSIVIARPDGKARLLEGFVDEGSLRQHVADALR